MIPIVTVHGGDVFPGRNEDYLTTVAKQALEYNPKFVLLGGLRNSHLGIIYGVDWHNYFTDYSSAADHFAERVHHQLSSYSYLYDLSVIKRYFVLREFMHHYAIPFVFSCDSDVMIYCDVEREAKQFGITDIAYCIPKNQPAYRWSASSHCAYFSYSALDDFCNFITDTYTNSTGLAKLKRKWTWHRRHKKPGGVCDMTFLYLFAKERNVVNLSQVIDDVAFDHHVNTPENYYPNEYRMSFSKRKQITWIDRQPYGFNLRLNHLVRFNAVHLQGGAKKFAEGYVRPRAKDY